jgi:hypothetical protein
VRISNKEVGKINEEMMNLRNNKNEITGIAHLCTFEGHYLSIHQQSARIEIASEKLTVIGTLFLAFYVLEI